MHPHPFRFLLILLLLAGLSACGGAEGRKQKYLEQANASFEKQDYEKARINFKNVLQIDPKDMAGREGYARTLEKLKDWRGAVSLYRSIVEDDPANLGAKVKLGQLYLLAKATDLADQMATEVLTANPAHDGGLALKAGVLVQQGKAPEGLVNAEQAYKLNAASIDNIILLASIYGGLKRSDDAIALLEKEVKQHPDSNSIHTLLAQIYLSSGRQALAEETLKKLVELNPDTLAFRTQLARFYETSARPDAAEAVLLEAVKAKPDDTETLTVLHRLYVQRKQLDKAEKLLRDAIARLPEQFDLQLALAGFFVAQKNIEAARGIYTELLEKDDVTALKAKNRLAYLRVLENKADDALVLLNEVLKDNPSDVEALKLRGGIYLAQKQADAAVGDLRAVLGAMPDSPDVLKMLGRAHLLNRDRRQALDLFKSALNLQPADLELRLMLSELYVDMQEGNEAAKQLEAANRIQPNNPAILEKLVRIYIDTRYFEDAEKMLAQLKTLDPDGARVPYFQGLILQRQDKHAEALTAFDEALRLKAGATEPMTSKVKSYIALKQIDQAIQWLAGLDTGAKPHPIALNLQGELYLAKKDWNRAREFFQRSADAQPGWWVPHRNRALVENAEKNAAAAVAYLAGVVDTLNAIPLRIELANYAQRAGDYEKAIQQYEAALAQQADNVLLANNLAMLIVTYKKDAEGLARARQLAERLATSDNPSYLDTAGWVQTVSGDYQRALPIMQQALNAAPNEPIIQYHLAMAYLGSNDKANAARYLEQALGSDKTFHGREEAEKTLAQLKQPG